MRVGCEPDRDGMREGIFVSLTSLRRALPRRTAVAAVSALGIVGSLGIAASASAATSSNSVRANVAQLNARSTTATSVSPANPLYLFLFIVGAEGLNGLNYLGGPYTVEGNMGVSTSTTVTSASSPAAYKMILGTTGQAASGLTKGYVVPSAETITFPKGFAMNLGVLSHELPYKDIANPSADSKIKPVGTLTLQSPLAALAGGSGTQTKGDVYLVSNKNPKILKPYMEMYFDGDYVVGTLNGLKFPMKVTFSEANVTIPGLSLHLGPQALPLSGLTVSFPAKTSPFVVRSCTKIGAPKATVTDALASYTNPILALDPHLQSGESTGPINIPSSKTVVTDKCK